MSKQVTVTMLGDSEFGSHDFIKGRDFTSKDFSGGAIPDSRLRLIRRQAAAQSLNGTVGPAIISSRITPAIGDWVRLTPSVSADQLGIAKSKADRFMKMASAEFESYILGPVSQSGTGLIQFLYDASRAAHAYGDCFIYQTYSKRRYELFGYGTCFVCVPGHLVYNHGMAVNSRRLQNGIEIDEYGFPVQLHIIENLDLEGEIHTVQPFQSRKGGLPVQRIYHLSFPGRGMSGRHRHEPLLAPVLSEVALLSEYRRATAQKALNESLLNFQVSGIPNPPSEELWDEKAGYDGNGKVRIQRLNGATSFYAPPGAEIKMLNGNTATSDYASFSIRGVLLEIASACEVSLDMVTRLTGSSYSGGTFNRQEHFRRISADRVSIYGLVSFMYQHILDEAVAMGAVKADGYLNSVRSRAAYARNYCVGPPMGSLNLLAEVRGRVMAQEAGFVTRSVNATEMGYDERLIGEGADSIYKEPVAAGSNVKTNKEV